ncbi:uncharacterized protein [Branchiostoma lanceolatum]|uniref:uncharacterized protein n=1 Tax=Branchiostoma lanceolatum TaxID=7740 RepID=UPI003451881F
MAGHIQDIQSWSDFAAAVDAGKDVVSLLGLDVSQQTGADSKGSSEQQQSKNSFRDNLRVDNIADQPLHFVFSHTSLDQKFLHSVCSNETEINSLSEVQPSCLPATLAVSPPTVAVAELFATSEQHGRGESKGSSSNKCGDKNS